MTITTTITPEKLDQYGRFSIATRTIDDDDAKTVLSINRRPIGPGNYTGVATWVATDISTEDPIIQAFANLNWTNDIITAYQTAFPFVPPPILTASDYPLQPYQFWAMVAIANLQTAIDNALSAITDPVQKAIATAKLNHTLSFNRNDPLVNLLGEAAGLTSDQIDAYWMQAKDL